MNFVVDLTELIKGIFQVLFAVPILGVLILLGTFGPIIVKAIRRR